jgi:hypothetical protein
MYAVMIHETVINGVKNGIESIALIQIIRVGRYEYMIFVMGMNVSTLPANILLKTVKRVPDQRK